MSGPTFLRTPGEIDEYWDHYAAGGLARTGAMFANRPDATSFRSSRKKLVAYLNHSRWVADCPMAECNGGIALWHDNPRAACLDCGTIFTSIEWPKETDMARALVAASGMRHEDEVNYDPRRESADDAVKRMVALA